MNREWTVADTRAAFIRFLNLTHDELRQPGKELYYEMAFMHRGHTKPLSVEPSSARLFRRVQKEASLDVRDLLAGKRHEEIERKINFPQPKSLVALVKKGTVRTFPNYNIEFVTRPSGVKLGNEMYLVAKGIAMESDLRKLAYGILRELLESGDIEKLGICARKECQKFKLHKTKPPKYCSDECRWAVNNAKHDRKTKRKKHGAWYRG